MCRKDPFANEVCVARTPSPYTPSEPPVARRLRPPATGHWRTPPPLQAGQVIGLGMESACSRRPTAALLPGARRVVGDDQRQGPGKTQTSTGPALRLKKWRRASTRQCGLQRMSAEPCTVRPSIAPAERIPCWWRDVAVRSFTVHCPPSKWMSLSSTLLGYSIPSSDFPSHPTVDMGGVGLPVIMCGIGTGAPHLWESTGDQRRRTLFRSVED